jgi:hypothetical protein
MYGAQKSHKFHRTLHLFGTGYVSEGSRYGDNSAFPRSRRVFNTSNISEIVPKGVPMNVLVTNLALQIIRKMSV